MVVAIAPVILATAPAILDTGLPHLAILGTVVRPMVLLVLQPRLSPRLLMQAIARAVQVIPRVPGPAREIPAPGRLRLGIVQAILTAQGLVQEIPALGQPRRGTARIKTQLSSPRRSRAHALAQTKLAVIKALQNRIPLQLRLRVLTLFLDPAEAVHKVHAETRVWEAVGIGEARLVDNYRRCEFL